MSQSAPVAQRIQKIFHQRLRCQFRLLLSSLSLSLSLSFFYRVLPGFTGFGPPSVKVPMYVVRSSLTGFHRVFMDLTEIDLILPSLHRFTGLFRVFLTFT